MGAGQSCDDVVDVVRLRQKENGPVIRPIIRGVQKTKPSMSISYKMSKANQR